MPGKGLTRETAMTGMLHGSAHVWVYYEGDAGIEVLLQRRSEDAVTWPSHLDISAAGHIDSGETPIGAALRETQEELGLALHREDLRLLFVYREYATVESTNLIENEYQWVYGYPLDTRIEATEFKGEIHSAQWLPLNELIKLAASPQDSKLLVPHGGLYFANLHRELVAPGRL